MKVKKPKLLRKINFKEGGEIRYENFNKVTFK